MIGTMVVKSCSVQLVRFIVIAFNTLFALCGLTLLGLGIWILVDERVVDILELTQDSHNSHLLRAAAIIIISMGCLLFVVSLMGCVGAILENTVLLGIYLALLIIAFCGEIAGAVIAISFKDWFLQQLKQVLRNSLLENEYYIDGSCSLSAVGDLWDTVQKKYDCCGVEASPKTGYEAVAYLFPVNCVNGSRLNKPKSCFTEPPNVKPKGCLDEMESWVGKYSPVLIGIGFGVAMLQMIGMIFIVCLCVNSPGMNNGYKRQR